MKKIFSIILTIFLSLSFENCIPDTASTTAAESDARLAKLERDGVQLKIEGARNATAVLKKIEQNLPEYTIIEKMTKYKDSLISLIYEISQEWSQAIKYNKNFSTEIDKLIEYYRDEEYYKYSDVIFQAIKEHLKELDKEQYRNTRELFAILSQLRDMTENPKGSLMTYNATAEKLQNDFTKTKTLAELEDEEAKDAQKGKSE